jgi:hypothetical protein
MAKNNDYLPKKKKDFYNFQHILIKRVKENGPRWGIDTSDGNEFGRSASIGFAVLLQKQTEYVAAYEEYIDPQKRTPGIVEKFNKIEKEFRSDVRIFVRSYLRFNVLVTEQDRKDIGLPVYKKAPTRARVKKTCPLAVTATPGPAIISFQVHDEKNKKFRIMPGQKGYEVIYIVSDEPVGDRELLIRTMFCSKARMRMKFDDSDRKKTLYFSLCWINTRGDKGPYSDIFSVNIP